MTDIFYDLKDKRFYFLGVETGNVSHDNYLADFEKCCRELNDCINTFAKQQDNNARVPQDTPLSLQDAISRGIYAIEKIKDKMCSKDFVELKRDFKIALIQKKYNIDINEMSPNINKIFREDEKWWKRIKIGGSHLFSTKATIKGRINRWFRQLVDYEGGTDINVDKLFYKLVQNNLDRWFKQLSDHKEAKEQQINNKLDKTIGLNTAIDNGYNNII